MGFNSGFKGLKLGQSTSGTQNAVYPLKAQDQLNHESPTSGLQDVLRGPRPFCKLFIHYKHYTIF